jgi:hypothetical protein
VNFSEQANRVGKLIADNSPAILTAVGAVGVVSTAFLTGKATFKAADIIRREQQEFTLDAKDKVELVWKEYIPAVATGAVSVAAIVFANRVGSRRAAAVATAYTLTEKAYAEYRQKIVEKIGGKKEEEYRAEIAQERVNDNPVSQSVVIIGGGTVLCYEPFTGRYFMSSVEDLKKAQNDTNYQILHDGYASLGDFYDRVGLPKTGVSDEIGWNAENRQLELRFAAVMSDDQRPCISVEFNHEPIRSFYRCN